MTPLDRLSGSPLHPLVRSFCLTLEIGKRSPATITTYSQSVLAFDAYLVAHNVPRDVSSITRDTMRAFLADTLGTRSAATCETRYAGLRSFFTFLVSEGTIKRSPLEGVAHPNVPEPITPVLTDAQVRSLLRSCEGKSFTARRDYALISFLLDTGARRSEAASVRVTDLDPVQRTALIRHGKGGRSRTVAFTAQTALPLDRYLRMREEHHKASSPFLWVGQNGPLSGDGVGEAVKRRGQRAGLSFDGRGLHAHMTRHYFADKALTSGMGEGTVALLGGWSPGSSSMRRYGKARAQDRALEEYQRLYGEVAS
jgi:site-specific recombinase XerD